MSRREKLEAMLEKDPGDPFLHFGLAMELVKAGELEAALARFDETLSRDSHYTGAYFHKAQTLISLDRTTDARRVIEEGITVSRSAGDEKTAVELEDLREGLA